MDKTNLIQKLVDKKLAGKIVAGNCEIYEGEGPQTEDWHHLDDLLRWPGPPHL